MVHNWTGWSLAYFVINTVARILIRAWARWAPLMPWIVATAHAYFTSRKCGEKWNCSGQSIRTQLIVWCICIIFQFHKNWKKVVEVRSEILHCSPEQLNHKSPSQQQKRIDVCQVKSFCQWKRSRVFIHLRWMRRDYWNILPITEPVGNGTVFCQA